MKSTSPSPARLALERIRDLGVKPAVVIDVGIAAGSPDLYGVFPDVRYLMVEPLAESAAVMQRVVDSHPGSIAVQAAAGRAAGEGQIVVSSNLSGSSFRLKPGSGDLRTVPIVTVDGLVEQHRLPGPYVLKIDVQGFELEVLAGAERTLGNTDLVITEASLWGDIKGAGRIPRLIELLTCFDAHDFALYDIAQIVRRALDGAITEMDLIFCPRHSPLRRITQYKSQEQTEQTTAKRRRSFGLS